MNKKLMVGIAAGAIILVGGAAVVATSAGGGKTGKYDYETVAVDRGTVARIVSASGAVQPLRKVDVGSEVSGKVKKLYVDFNSKVKKGDILAQIDPETFQNALDQARARQAQSQASVDSSKAAIERAKVALEVAESNWKRQKALYAEQAIAQSAWEQADQTYKNAQLQLQTDTVSLKSAEAGLLQAVASVQDAALKLDRTRIISPIDGIIINRKVDEGMTVQSSMTVAPIVTVAEDLSKIQIEAAVVESDIGGIDQNDPVRFTVDAFPGERFNGIVTQVRVLGAEQANVVTYTVVVQASNPNGKLLPGMTANVEITASQENDVLRIADSATHFQPPKDVLEKLGGAGGQRPGGQGGPGGFPGGGQGGPQVAGFQFNGGDGAPPGAGQQRNASFQGGPGGGQGGQGGERGQRGQGGGERGQRGQGGPGGNPMNEWLKEAGVDEARITKISAEFQSEMEKVRASVQMPTQGNQPGGVFAGGGFGGPPQSIQQQAAMQEMRTKMQQAQDAVLKRNLNEDELAKVTKARAEMQAQKPVTVYKLNDKGEPERARIMVGLSDGNFAQIMRGAKEGDKFIIRANPAGAKSAQKKP
ncbi:MAG TPA: efflux RND transporter periplasmic adaptor subunit [Hyphomonadaceae bacterium]|nr:efflux RND transporter periplasmic adaptor subunit [Hyphomonadaceae bacterium]